MDIIANMPKHIKVNFHEDILTSIINEQVATLSRVPDKWKQYPPPYKQYPRIQVEKDVAADFAKKSQPSNN